MTKKRLSVALVLVLLLVVLAYIAPALLITNGTEKFQGQDKQHAHEAIDNLTSALSTPSLYIIWTTQFKVVDLQNRKDDCGYNATIQSYSYFGRKMDKWLVSNCGSHTI